MKETETVAMLLAGGQGTRLEELTSNLAKPGVVFGGKYRIIDFSLSNCYHSEIYTVGVMTQYRPLLLNRYIGNGSAWALDRQDKGVYILPPYMSKSDAQWYGGTADAVYQNFEFIEMYDPKYVVILSGDHIYQMNYQPMIDMILEHDADLVISTREVPWEDTFRFGIVETDETMRITKFEEKPENATSNFASMGIYVFKWSVLKEALEKDHQNEESGNDFGHDVIPMLLKEDKRIYAYLFEDYWRDVGTVESYYEANMDLLDDREDLDLTKSDLRVYSNNENREPHYIGLDAKISNSLICDGCVIEGTVDHSVLGYDIVVEEGAVVEDSIILNDVVIEKGAVIKRAIINAGSVIKKDQQIGSEVGKVTLYVEDENL